MAWQTPITSDYNLNSALGVTAISRNSNNKLPKLYYVDTIRTFNANKTQIIKTKIRNLTTGTKVNLATGMSFSVSPIHSDKLEVSRFLTQSIPVDADYIYHYSKPSSTRRSTQYAYYEAGPSFSSPMGIESIEFLEISWEVNGFMLSDNGSNSYSLTTHGLGWKFIDSSTSSSSFVWYDSLNSDNYPIGGTDNFKSATSSYRKTNFITKFIPYQFFNFYFDYEKITGSDSDGIRIYLTDDKPSITTSTSSFENSLISELLIATISRGISDPINADFYGLQGQKYITIIADDCSSSTQSLLISLSNIVIEGGYHNENNEIQNMILPTYTTSITGATYTTFVGNGNTINASQSLSVSQIFSRIGNGKFKSGIWENGVWNSGWREDENVKEFDDADISYRSISDIRWVIRIAGPSASVSNFSIGDKVSIGNIVAIDINEKRKLLKNSFTIINAQETGIDERRGFIVVEADTPFPIRRIEKDSINHRIKVTKNIWLNGAFLNGYFTGVWNNGLMKGYPLITEMYNTNWIDGTFMGGHFNSQISVTGSFTDTRYSNGKVGLTFSTPHNLIIGDIITIDKTDKTLNPQYDGETTITSITNDYLVVTDLDWGSNTTNESGNFTTKIANGLIQNFKFYDGNISKITSASSLESDSVFIFNSWVDVNYDSTSAVNIGKPQTLINSLSNKSYSENNLYGYPTYEVLSSESQFRDSFSNTKRNYSLGTKYTLFNDYVGDSSNFDEYFGPTGSNLQLFYDQGWTFSSAGPDSITFSRTIGNENSLVEGKELKVDAISEGGILDLSTPNIIVNNRTDNDIPKNRYTIIEFDLVTYSVNETLFEDTQIPWGPIKGGLSGFKGENIIEPLIHFNNINITTLTIIYPINSFDVYGYATYLPIYQNVNHLTTPGRNKVEYFYNKRNLGMHFRGSGLYGTSQSQFIIDNLKLVEVDMIPFFQYFQTSNINTGIQIPYQGIAPYIDYTDANFVFLDNISLGFDSYSIISTNEVYSGVGPGIGIFSSGISSGVADSIEFGESSI